MEIDHSIDTLLDMDGYIVEQENGYWFKIEARRVSSTNEIPHGIRYSLTLHDKYGTRVMGFDNAHAVKPPKKYKYSGRKMTYDHKHRTSHDKGVPYEFETAEQLLADFFQAMDSIIKGEA
jgi:hypothetical protein